jgi:hypothetical protein
MQHIVITGRFAEATLDVDDPSQAFGYQRLKLYVIAIREPCREILSGFQLSKLQKKYSIKSCKDIDVISLPS